MSPMKCPCCGQPIPVSDDVIVSLDTNSITVRGVSLRLRPREAEILRVLVNCMPTPVRRTVIIASVWALTEREPTAKGVDVHVSNLRRKIKPLGLAISTYTTIGFALVDTRRQRAAA